ncbi:Hypothetical protein RG1141_CH10420 [Neorhizobium galegae bv. officinalis bv. officinalis str. HAMBI 1141]|uniref:Uncharacterized protein n=1 Tax=Neorhizobium galegae bv. officinalis bv. officinalis str. HAMBI 1141 TaxID=1028801 RepID=A0A068T5U1_NEOGA|nr:Hypothetical protein RG1141_CH10420 [Neorhizobium galegae bv. officinalis bv. officinalis str. HAMBI 1141]
MFTESLAVAKIILDAELATISFGRSTLHRSGN